MVQLLDYTWYVRDQVVPCLVGPPGIGKTAAVEKHALAHHSKVIKIVASRCVPSETVGMTMPDNENKTMMIYNSMQLSSLKDGDILFFDELLEADQFVLSTLLTLIESREMADGTPLPDIQIIAATNDTIPPEQLKPNIRQRFMFMRFKVDKRQTYMYIRKLTGIKVPRDVLDTLADDGTDYNFLTPRSLTKLCLMFDRAPKDILEDLSKMVNEMWGSNIGTTLKSELEARDARATSPEEQVRDTIIKMVEQQTIEVDDETSEKFLDCTMSEMFDILQGLENWEDIMKELNEKEVVEDEGK